MIWSPYDLGRIITLSVKVGNLGPSTIQNVKVNITFPGPVDRISTTSPYYLYPVNVIAVSASNICLTTHAC